jgi:hypothetical protein
MGLLWLFALLVVLVDAKPVEMKMYRKAKKIVRDASGVAVNVRDPRSVFNKLNANNALSLRKGKRFQQSFPLR